MPKSPTQPSRSMPCAKCGVLMWRSKSSLPPGQATCRPCRRAARRHDCLRCGSPVDAVRKFCSRRCRFAAQREAAAAAEAKRLAVEALTLRRKRWVYVEAVGDPQKRMDGPQHVAYLPTGEVVLDCRTCRYESEYVDYDTGEVVPYVGTDRHPLYLDDTFTVVCWQSSPPARYTVLLGPERWRSGIGRLRVPVPPRIPDQRQCSECSTLFAMKTPNQITCSALCRTVRAARLYREKYDREKQPAYRYDCACCGVPCSSPQPHARYCSLACNKRASKRRSKGKSERSPVLMPRMNARRAE